MAFKQTEKVAVVNKNSAEQIVITKLVTQRGDTLADLRLFFANGEMEHAGTADETFAYKPSPKGIAIPERLLPEIIAALQEMAPDEVDLEESER